MKKKNTSPDGGRKKWMISAYQNGYHINNQIFAFLAFFKKSG